MTQVGAEYRPLKTGKHGHKLCLPVLFPCSLGLFTKGATR
jgi:hypothetical protein